MEKGVNLQIFELKEELIKTLNTATLPMSVKRMSLQEILATVTALEQQELATERKALEEKETEEQPRK